MNKDESLNADAAEHGVDDSLSDRSDFDAASGGSGNASEPVLIAANEQSEEPPELSPPDIDDNWYLPVAGTQTTYENHHRINNAAERVSVDIYCSVNTPVRAANHGKVIERWENPSPQPWNDFVENGISNPRKANQPIPFRGGNYSYMNHPDGFSAFGNYIIIEHYEGYNADGSRKVIATTAYAHLNEIAVIRNAPVLRGQLIGNSGGADMTRAKNLSNPRVGPDYFYFPNFGPDGSGGSNTAPARGPFSSQHLHYERPRTVGMNVHEAE